jgi:hypothetical protein
VCVLAKRDSGLSRSKGGISIIVKAKSNPEKTKAGLDEMEAAVETGPEEMKPRMDFFKEKLDKMDPIGKTCVGKMEANIETGQEPREAESKTDLEEMDTMGLEANQEKSEAVAVHQEVPNEEAMVETIRAPEVQSCDQEPAVGYYS